MTQPPTPPAGYASWLTAPKTRIREARLRAALTVNSELIDLYWQIGRDIRERQAARGWGAKVVDRLAADLRAEFPDSRGFSSANLRYMRAFAEAWPDPAILQRIVGKLPWGQNIELLAIKDAAVRLWYAEAVLERGWSRPVLAAQIDTQARARQGRALTNFARVLPPEREVERALLTWVKDLLLELGKGSSFIASQHHLEVGGQDFYVDLLFYHRKLRCLIAVDLKTGPFQPEHAGKMNFYRAAVDDRDREPGDNPSIGLILCRERNRVVVEYALRGVDTPIGVARYQLMLADALPAQLAEALPSPQELEPGCCLTMEPAMHDQPAVDHRPAHAGTAGRMRFRSLPPPGRSTTCGLTPHLSRWS